MPEYRQPRGRYCRARQQVPPLPWPEKQRPAADGRRRRDGRHSRVRAQRQEPDTDQDSEQSESQPARPSRRELGGMGVPGSWLMSWMLRLAEWAGRRRTVPAAGPRQTLLSGAGAVSGHRAVRRAARAVAATARAATAARDPVADPRPSQGSRTALVSSVSGRGPATCRTTEPITCGGGPPAPSRNDGKKISRPTAWADRADGSTEPSSTPRLTKAIEPRASAAVTRHHACTGGMP